jgi:hypothetical protein
MEDIYERLCWLYTTLCYTLVFHYMGEAHNLMHISDLFRGKIPYPEQFPKKPEYEQESLIQDLWMKDIHCTRTDWINLGGGISRIWSIVVMQMETRNIFPWKAYHIKIQ